MFGKLTMTELVIATFLIVLNAGYTSSISEDPNALSFDRLYTLGIAAYEDERWFQCVSFISRAIEEQKHFADIVYKCRLQCKSGKDKRLERFKEKNNSQLLNLFIFQDLILNVECVRRCKKKNIGDGPRAVTIFNSICQAFSELKPYDYLQICAFKTNDMKQAVAAAYTFFLGNPSHSDMLNNLQYYRNLPGVLTEDFVNLEEQSFQTHYIEGTVAYSDNDWTTVIEEMETALEEFFVAEERCRLECEGILDTGQSQDSQDVLSIISVLYSQLLRCQLGCEDKLGVIHSKLVPDYVADHYHYLQYSYFKLKNFEKASGAAESYLLFKPTDDIMLNNKLYFIKRGHGETLFVPRKEALEYSKRKNLIRDILHFVEEAPWYEDEDDTYNVYVKKNFLSMGDYRGNPGMLQAQNAPANPFVQHFERLGIKVFADSEVLHGPERFAADGLMRPEQCQELIYLSQAVYDNDSAPPLVQDLNIPQAVEMVKNDQANDVSLRILLRVSEISRFFLQQYLNLTKVYLQSTRLICRDHKDPSTEEDCYIQEDGSCLRWFPVDARADYVAVIHLNQVTTGGEIYVANQNLNGQGMMITPKCGRMVGFPANVPHGVLPFHSGVRCSLVFGYSKNRTNDEKAHSQAFRYLDKLEDKKQEEHLDRLRNRKTVLEGIKNEGISITFTDEDLGGEERVVADHLLTQDGCDFLLRLAMSAGRGGDGYNTGLSPHTSFESFKGLTVERAVKNGSLTGDGYRDKRYNTQSSISPHTKYEMFQGLTVLRAAQLANLGAVGEDVVEMYLNKSEKSRDFVEKYFNLESPLYFDFTHLVCRTAIEAEEGRDDLSHPVHADNCILQEDQTCVRQFPAYTQRDYSALLYLNDDFEGGDFFFAFANKSEQVSLRPKCGRLVGFNAAAYHGVKAVTKGERCALALWFTLDPDFKEIAHLQAKKMLRDRRNNPNYSLPSSSPLFTMPGINEKESDSSEEQEEELVMDDEQDTGDETKLEEPDLNLGNSNSVFSGKVGSDESDEAKAEKESETESHRNDESEGNLHNMDEKFHEMDESFEESDKEYQTDESENIFHDSDNSKHKYNTIEEKPHKSDESQIYEESESVYETLTFDNDNTKQEEVTQNGDPEEEEDTKEWSYRNEL